MNTNSKHTSGPWRVGKSEHHAESVFGADRVMVADCSIFYRDQTKRNQTINQANARVIAAAPQMKAAGNELAAAAADIHPTAPSSASVDRLHAAMDAWDDVVAEAEGRAAFVSSVPNDRGGG